MKHILLILLVIIGKSLTAQKVDSIYVNLYTDSLKKGTYNYINVDGLLKNGRYEPLDSTTIIFTTDYGHFSGNSLVLPSVVSRRKVHIKVELRENKKVCKEFDLFIKSSTDPELPSEAEILNNPAKKTSKKKSYIN